MDETIKIDRLNESIKALDSLLKGGSIDFDSFYRNVPFRMLFYKKSFCLGSVFRATILSHEDAINPALKSRFSYPDPNRGIKVTRGRANIEDHPVFYCSNTLAGAIDEIILTMSDTKSKEKIKRVFVSEWSCEKTAVSTFDVRQKIPLVGSELSIVETQTINVYLGLFKDCYLNNNAYDFTSKFSHYILNDKGRF